MTRMPTTVTSPSKNLSNKLVRVECGTLVVRSDQVVTKGLAFQPDRPTMRSGTLAIGAKEPPLESESPAVAMDGTPQCYIDSALTCPQVDNILHVLRGKEMQSKGQAMQKSLPVLLFAFAILLW